MWINSVYMSVIHMSVSIPNEIWASSWWDDGCPPGGSPGPGLGHHSASGQTGLMFQQRKQQYRMCQTWLDSDLGNRWASMLSSPRNCWHTVGTWGQLLKCTSGNPGPTVWLAHGGPKASSISPGEVKLDFHLVSPPWNLRPMLRSRDQSHLNI